MFFGTVGIVAENEISKAVEQSGLFESLIVDFRGNAVCRIGAFRVMSPLTPGQSRSVSLSTGAVYRVA